MLWKICFNILKIVEDCKNILAKSQEYNVTTNTTSTYCALKLIFTHFRNSLLIRFSIIFEKIAYFQPCALGKYVQNICASTEQKNSLISITKFSCTSSTKFSKVHCFPLNFKYGTCSVRFSLILCFQFSKLTRKRVTNTNYLSSYLKRCQMILSSLEIYLMMVHIFYATLTFSNTFPILCDINIWSE